MARINIDTYFFTDPRVEFLAIKTGLNQLMIEAMLIRVWASCYHHVSTTQSRKQVDMAAKWNGKGSFADHMEECQLASKVGLDEFRIHGTDDRIEYLREAKEHGKRSAEIRKLKYGTAQPLRLERCVELQLQPPKSQFVLAEGSSKVPSSDIEGSFMSPSSGPEPLPLPLPLDQKEREYIGVLTNTCSVLIFDLWEQNPHLASIKKRTAKRLTTAAARWKDEPDPNYWREVFAKMASNPFFFGENERHWKATIDWFLRPDTHVSIMEGKYDWLAPKAVTRQRAIDV